MNGDESVNTYANGKRVGSAAGAGARPEASRLAGVRARFRAIRILPEVCRTWGFRGARQTSACRSAPLPCRRRERSVQ